MVARLHRLGDDASLPQLKRNCVQLAPNAGGIHLITPTRVQEPLAAFDDSSYFRAFHGSLSY
jgi:hypothetical protein